MLLSQHHTRNEREWSREVARYIDTDDCLVRNRSTLLHREVHYQHDTYVDFIRNINVLYL